ncbi:MAG TPA: hypothetical protein VMM13_17570 [Euzebya sp.]|nr:hypothetical protein [Euzebya sp.]
MSAVWVRLDEAQRGSLPARCARSGERSITRYPHEVSDLPAPLEWTTWTRLWPRRHGQETVSVIVPLLPSRQRAAAMLRRTRDITAGLLPVALLVMLMADGIPGQVARTLVLVALLLRVVVASLGLMITVRLRADTTGEWVMMSGVHPEFAAAAEAVTSRPTQTPVLAEAPIPRIAGAASGEPAES